MPDWMRFLWSVALLGHVSAISDDILPQSLNFGFLSDRCDFCGAHMFPAERNSQNKFGSLCCNNGVVRLPPLPDPPVELQKMYTASTREANVIITQLKNIQKLSGFEKIFVA